MIFWQLTIDSRDPKALAAFWASALGYQPAPPVSPEATWWQHYRSRQADGKPFEDRIFDPDGLRPPLWFQAVPEEKAGRNRLHLDIYPTGRDQGLRPDKRVELVEAKVAELTALGATVARRESGDDPGDEFYFAVLRDPEGNEFCVG
jgi:hypothetical protein